MESVYFTNFSLFILIFYPNLLFTRIKRKMYKKKKERQYHSWQESVATVYWYTSSASTTQYTLFFIFIFWHIIIHCPFNCNTWQIEDFLFFFLITTFLWDPINYSSLLPSIRSPISWEKKRGAEEGRGIFFSVLSLSLWSDTPHNTLLSLSRIITTATPFWVQVDLRL